MVDCFEPTGIIREKSVQLQLFWKLQWHFMYFWTLKATEALWKIMTTMIEKQKMKNKVQKTRKVNSIQLESDDGSNSSATCIHCHFYALQFLLSDIVQISYIQTGFLFCFIISSRFNSVELSPTYSHSTLPLAFCVHSCKYSEAFPLSKLLIEFHSKCCCCAALYFSLSVCMLLLL